MRRISSLLVLLSVAVGGCAETASIFDSAIAHMSNAFTAVNRAIRGETVADDRTATPDENYRLALSYMSGEAAPRDDAKAAQYLSLAAEQGHAEAQYLLAASYWLASENRSDEALAVGWFRRAAEQDHVQAQFQLGIVYLNGLGAPRDQAEAANWYRRAAEQGHPEAQFMLASLYVAGVGVSTDYFEAEKWFSVAAREGHPRADIYRDAITRRLASGEVGIPRPGIRASRQGEP